MKSYHYNFLLRVSVIFSLVAGRPLHAVSQARLTPTADGYIYLAGRKMNQSFGEADTLITRTTRNAESTASSYIRFDLSREASGFSKAVFNIYSKADRTKLLDVYAAMGDWSDLSLNGGAGAKPSRKHFIGSFEVTPEEKYREVDITPYVNRLRSGGINDFTIVLVEREQQADGEATRFYSKEHPSGKTPFLSLTPGTARVNPAGTTYYVDAIKGNDLAGGTSPNTAWKTLKKLESVFFQQGDQIRFKRGNIFKGSLFLKVLPASTGITKIGAYGKGEKPVLDAEGRESFCLMIFNTPYMEVEDLEITHSAKDVPSIRRGIYYLAEDMGEVNHVYFRNITFRDIVGNKGKEDGDLYAKRNAGLALEITGNNTPTYMNGYLIEGCRFFRVGRHGAVNQSTWSKRTLDTNTNWVPSRNVVIRNNVFEETASDGLIVRVADGPLMEYNLFKRCSVDLSGNASFTFNCDNALWQYNEACYTVYNTGDLDAAGFDSDFKSRNTIFQFNYAHHNEYGDMLITGGPGNFGGFNDGTIVRYNVFYNNGHHGIRISGVATNSKIYNNVIYKDQNVAKPTEPYVEFVSNRLFYTKNWGGWPKDAVYSNNIYYYDHKAIPSSSDLNEAKSPGSVFFNNIIYSSNQLSAPEQTGGLSSNPLFNFPKNIKSWEGLDRMRFFQLKPGSPAVDKGIEIENTVPGDFNGTVIPQNSRTDIGAFEQPQGVTGNSQK